LFRAADFLPELYHEPHMGWALAASTETHVLPCEPNDVVREPTATELGALLQWYLGTQRC
jgi:hypothetical protein